MFACAFDTFSEYLAVTRLLKVYSLTLIFQVITAISGWIMYLLYKQENADNLTKYHNNGGVKWDGIKRVFQSSLSKNNWEEQSDPSF